MVYAIAAKSGQRPMWNQLEHAIRRNFGGLVEGEPVEIFKRHFQITDVSINKTPWSVHFGVLVVELINCKCGGTLRHDIWYE